MAEFAPGQMVQTPLGKGVVREVRNNGRVLVHVQGTNLLIGAGDITPLGEPRRRRHDRTAGDHPSHPEPQSHSPFEGVPLEVDLHGLTVEQALDRAVEAVSHALLADASELRLIHGKSGGRIRTALHPRLRSISSVRTVRLDPANEGVTIVTF